MQCVTGGDGAGDVGGGGRGVGAAAERVARAPGPAAPTSARAARHAPRGVPHRRGERCNPHVPTSHFTVYILS